MQTKNYFSHTSPTYGSPFDMMKAYGISYKSAGENIAMGQRSPEEVVQAWMNSQGHRENIMNPNFTHIGVGHVATGTTGLKCLLESNGWCLAPHKAFHTKKGVPKA